ncbi:hypothetical protein D3C73_1402370 [compost metagenome]
MYWRRSQSTLRSPPDSGWQSAYPRQYPPVGYTGAVESSMQIKVSYITSYLHGDSASSVQPEGTLQYGIVPLPLQMSEQPDVDNPLAIEERTHPVAAASNSPVGDSSHLH